MTTWQIVLLVTAVITVVVTVMAVVAAVADDVDAGMVMETFATPVYSQNALLYDVDGISQLDPNMWPAVKASLKMYGRLPNPLDSATGLIVDPLDWNTVVRPYALASQAMPKGFFVIAAGRATAVTMNCGFDLAGRKIGVLTSAELNMTHALLKGYRVPADAVTLVPIPSGEWTRLDVWLQRGDVDLVMIYVVPNSPMHHILGEQNLVFMGFQGVDLARVQLFYPYVQAVDQKLAGFTTNLNLSTTTVLETSQVLARLSPSAATAADRFEPFIARLDRSADLGDSRYECWGDHNIGSKGLCNSPYDAQGFQKMSPTSWDRPCESHREHFIFNAL